MEQVTAYWGQWTTFCDKKFKDFPQVADVASKSGIKNEQFALALLALLLLFIYVVGGGTLIVNLIGFVYPAMASLRVLDSKDAAGATQWLTYWIVFALFNVVELMTSWVEDIIPFYFLIKCGFLYWCWAPGFNGATTVYKYVKPRLHAVLKIE